MDTDIEMYFRYIDVALDRILKSMDGLDSDGLNWEPIPEDTSSLYVIGTHIMGNIEQAILATLAGHPDYRDRDAEFAAKGDSVDELREKWASLRGRLVGALGAMSPADLERPFQHPRRGRMSGWEILLTTATHAHEHVGHCELTRQLWDAR